VSTRLEDAGGIVPLLKASPKIERLQLEGYFLGADLVGVLDGCPCITTITGLTISLNHENEDNESPGEILFDLVFGEDTPRPQRGSLSDLKKALNQQWSKPARKDAPKKLGLVLLDPRIGAGGVQDAAAIASFSEWAADVNCELEWRAHGGSLTVNCSSSNATAHPAPDGHLYGEIARQLAAKATDVTLVLGGTAPLLQSWWDKLIFPCAKKLILCPTQQGASGPFVDSIPEWLTERDGEGETAASRCFPAVDSLEVSFDTLSPAEPARSPQQAQHAAGWALDSQDSQFLSSA